VAVEKEKAAIAKQKEAVPNKIFKEPNTKNTMARYLQSAISKGTKKKEAQQESTL